MMLFPKQLKPLMFAQMRKQGRAARSVFAFLTGVAATLIFPPYAGRWVGYVALIAFLAMLLGEYRDDGGKCGRENGFETFKTETSGALFLAGIIGFLTIMIEAVIFQQKCVDTTKKMNPEKTASVYDTKFQKKWMESCDEAEKFMIGKCAFKAYAATNTVCSILSIVLAICALVFGIGFLPSLVVCLIWIVNQSVYCKEALKYSKAGNKIS